MNKAASEGELATLHSKVAKVMTTALDQIEKRQEQWENHEPAEGELLNDPPEVNPALMSVMVRFLDANKITCAPEAGNTTSELEKKLEERRNKRRKVVGNVAYLHENE